MAGNNETFQEAMQTAADAAWDQDWDGAISAYQEALEHSPDDVNALSGLGLAYSSVGRVKDALEAYERAADLEPDDPVLLERIGQLQEQLGHGEAASRVYLACADCYLNQQQATHLALERWRDATRAWPDCVQAHAQLLRCYQQGGQVQKAVAECLALARIYRSRGQVDHAAQVCEHALKLDPHNSKVLGVLDGLHQQEPPVSEEVGEEEGEPPAEVVEEPPSPDDLDLVSPEVEAEDRGSPVDLARQKALSDLAESFFEEEAETRAPAGVPPMKRAEIDGLLGRAIDFQTRGEIEQAIDAYERAIRAGADRPAVHFNLGLLYQEKLRFEAAISEFERAVPDGEYKLGSCFALGECYRAKGRVDQALEHFIEVLKIVDMATVQRDHADDLIQLYEHLADGYVAMGDRDQALEFTNSLVTFLSEKGWEDKVIEARRRLDELAEGKATISLAEVLANPSAESILESIALSQEYTKRGMFYTALEECYSALRVSPCYLPTHRQIAQVLLGMGKVENAVAKFVSIAGTYLARGNFRRAAAMFKRGLKLSPMDTTVRAKLIDMLVSHGEIEEALENYLTLADSYYNLAQMDRAREVYQEALRLAPRGDPRRRWKVRILHKIGDIDMQRVDWKRATDVYRQIRKIAPEDERARMTLVGLYHRLGRSAQAMAELDELLKIHRQRGQTERIFAILGDMVKERPDDIPLRTRLAQAYLDAGETDQALEHLDKLGDLQLEAGKVEDAKLTVRAIIALNPPNVEAYQQALAKIEGRSSG